MAEEKESYLIPGATFPNKEIKTTLDEEESAKNCEPQTWSNCDCTTFNVRKGPNYSVNGQKAPSKAGLYKIFAIDTFRSAKKVKNVSKYFKVPKLKYIKDSKIPPVVIINVMVPNYSPPTFSWSDKTDGDGFSIIIFAELTKESRELIEKGELSPSLRLFKNFVNAAPDSSYRSCFKGICRIMNNSQASYGMIAQTLVSRYNSTPFLCRTTTSFYLKEEHYFEIEIDSHRFGKIARQGLSNVRDYLSSVVFDFGFVIEGRPDAELPEQMLCAARISKTGTKFCTNFPL